MTFRPFLTLPCYVACALPWGAAVAFGQIETDPASLNDEEIVVFAPRLPGAVETKVAPVDELDARDVEDLAASSVGEVLDEIATRTSSGRGRGGAPVILLNGRRISNFREIREYPPETIRKIEIFPEEVALQFGYPPNQRVVNIILVEHASIIDTEVEFGTPERTSFTSTEFDASLTRIAKGNRLSLHGEYGRKGAITEAERGVSSVPLPVDEAAYRSLQGRSTDGKFNLNWAHELTKGVNLTAGGEFGRTTSHSLLGLYDGTVTVPASSPFARTPGDETVQLGFDELGPVRRNSWTETLSANAGLTGALAKWQWSFTNDISRSTTTSTTDGDLSLTALQAGVSAGTIDPFADDLSSFLSTGDARISRSQTDTLASTGTISGNLFKLPAGPVTTSLKLSYSGTGIDSSARNGGASSAAKLRRDAGNGLLTLSIPLTSKSGDLLPALRNISVQINAGRTYLSDFDSLDQYGAGLNWAPTSRLSASIQYIAEDKAPSLANLGDAQILTPDVAIYDFRTGQTVQIDRLTGGNPALRAERQRDLKVALNWRPAKPDGLNVNLEYFRNRSRDVTADFPLLTDAIEAAFPGRVVRDPFGQLLSIDARPINYARRESDSLRFGIGYRGTFGTANAKPLTELQKLEQQMRSAGGAPGNTPARSSGGAGQPQGNMPANAAGGPRPGTGPGTGMRGPGGAAGPPPNDGRGRWDVDVTYTLQLSDRATIASGVPELDFLNGDASGSSGGARRHKVDLRAGITRNGLGMRLTGSYQSGSQVHSDTMSSQLNYAELFSANLRFFLNFEQKPQIVKALPLLKGSRLSLRIDNVLDTAQRVTDGTGVVPLRYAPAFQEPVGRYFEIEWRKKL